MVFYPNTNTTYTFSGQLNNGPFTAATGITASDNFALVPNPYPSAIDWDAASGWTKTNLQNAIWIWNPMLDQYASYISGVGTNGGSQYIPTGQAFFVKSSAASTVLAMNNDVRVHSSTAFLKSTNELPSLLRIHAQANQRSDEAVLLLREGSLTGKDPFDGDKLYGAPIAPQLYFLLPDARELAINNIPPDALPISLPLGFKLQADGWASLNFDGIESFDHQLQFLLEDLLTGTLTNLRQSPAYSFVHSQNNSPQRFVLHLTGITGIDHPTGELPFKAWFDGRDILISMPQTDGTAQIELFDVAGRLLANHKLMAQPILRLPAPQSKALLIRLNINNRLYTTKVFTY